MTALSILGCVFNVAAIVLSARVSTRFGCRCCGTRSSIRSELFAAEMERFGTASLVTRSTST